MTVSPPSNAPITPVVPPDTTMTTTTTIRRRMWMPLWGLLTVLLVCVVPVMLPLIIGINGVNSVIASVNDTFDVSIPSLWQSSVTIEQSRSLITDLSGLSELTSVSMQMATSDIRVHVWQGVFGSCSFTARHVGEATIEAGIDLSRVTAEDIRYNAADDTYTITLPAPHLSACYTSIERYADSLPLTCNADWEEVRQLAMFNATTAFRNEALEGGLLERAARETETGLGSFIRSLGGSGARFVFRPPTDPMIADESCDPEPPLSWRQDEFGTWSRATG